MSRKGGRAGREEGKKRREGGECRKMNDLKHYEIK